MMRLCRKQLSPKHSEKLALQPPPVNPSLALETHLPLLPPDLVLLLLDGRERVCCQTVPPHTHNVGA